MMYTREYVVVLEAEVAFSQNLRLIIPVIMKPPPPFLLDRPNPVVSASSVL
jgi:hypothetical protein